jgi:hypothetical protein
VVAACLGWPAAAQAQEPGAGSPSVDQYVESVPTGTDRAAQAPPATAEPRRASPRVRRALRRDGGSDAAALERVVTAPQLGAPAAQRGSPQDRRDDPAGRPAAQRGAPAPETQALRTSEPGVATAAAGAFGAAGPFVMAALAAMALAGVLGRWRRLRR